ncbi:flagellar biosynthetic protein FliQ [Clostridium ganghwense]|uniref:Flagellar biosynthetic protein FliQ n=1 Tax=Clostridium ganghwense TaxID=312089 RepID=A0ABT4CMW7_9CLOT|nr:flagellar biosynthetic protein FliQ [Clostridium ganghwense]MCY6370377.1 flagellar biosynthetic protein FliQ [Clostridium ganghwense]
MSEEMIIGVLRDAITTGIKAAAPILIVAIVIGLAVSIFQATTQIQEQTLTFVPKLIGVALMGLVTSKFIMHTVVTFTERIFAMIANIMK